MRDTVTVRESPDAGDHLYHQQCSVLRQQTAEHISKVYGSLDASHLPGVDTFDQLPVFCSNPAGDDGLVPVPVPDLKINFVSSHITADVPGRRDLGRVITARIGKDARAFMIVTDLAGGDKGSPIAGVCAQRLLVGGDGVLHLDHERTWLQPGMFGAGGLAQAWLLVSRKHRLDAIFQLVATEVGVGQGHWAPRLAACRSCWDASLHTPGLTCLFACTPAGLVLRQVQACHEIQPAGAGR